MEPPAPANRNPDRDPFSETIGHEPRARVPEDIHSARTVFHGSGASPPPKPGRTATPPADLQEFTRALLDTGLIEAGTLQDTLAALPVADRPSNPEQLARVLVRAGLLTRYQAAAVYQGKAKGLVIGPYLVLDKLGAGGMGLVYKAEHRRIRRVVALKLLPPSLTRDSSAVARFRREAEAAGRLRHPNLVAALDADQYNGLHYLAMEFVAGRDLERIVAESGPLTVAQALNCTIQAARGLQEAHAHGIIHRDIKPSNLLLDPEGTVKVLDLGLARLAEAADALGHAGHGLTQTGMIMGTVDYMSPEQADDSRKADARSDIYSLGCTLHYLLTGRPPFEAETVLKRLMAHQERAIPSLREARADVPSILDGAFRRMLAKKPEDRLPAMAKVIELLETCRHAPPDPADTNDAAISTFELAENRPKVAPNGNGGINPPDAIRTPASRAGGKDPSIFAVKAPEPVIRSDADIDLSDLWMDVPTANDLAKVPTAPGPRSPKSRVPAHAPKPTGRSRPPTGRLVALVGGLAALIVLTIVGYRTFLKPDVPDAKAPPVIAGHAPPKPKPRAARLPVAVKVEPPAENLVELGRFVGHSRSPVRKWNGSPAVEAVAVSPDGRRALSVGLDRVARLWEVANGCQVRYFYHPNVVWDACFLPDGRHALTASDEGNVRLWDVETGREVRKFAGHSGGVRAVAVSADGRRALSSGFDNTIGVWDVETGQSLHVLRGHKDTCRRVAISDDGRWGLSASEDQRVGYWDLQNGRNLAMLEGHTARVWGVAFNPSDNSQALSAGNDGLILWDLDHESIVRRMKAPEDAPHALAVTADGRQAITGGGSGRVTIWELATGRALHVGQGPAAVEGIAPLPFGLGILTADQDGLVRTWGTFDDLAHARKLIASDQTKADALPFYAKMIDRRPDDGRLRIERGRLLAELGRSKEAEADFAHAASLASAEPQLFLDGGWWVAGPYYDNFADKMPPEDDPDPSKAMPGLGPSAELGPKGVRWQRAATGYQGLIDLAAIFPRDAISTYALAYVQSETEQTVAMLIGSDDSVRVWLNGGLVNEYNGPRAAAPGQAYVPVKLRAGRNTILAKIINIKGVYKLFLRLSRAPADLGIAFANLGLWEQAAAADRLAFLEAPSDSWVHERLGTCLVALGRRDEALAMYQKALENLPDHVFLWSNTMKLLLDRGDLAGYRRAAEEVARRFGRSGDLYTRNNALWACCLGPGGLKDYRPYLKPMVEVINRDPNNRAYLNTLGCFEYRAGQNLLAINHLKKSVQLDHGKGHVSDWVFLAMAYHREGKVADARVNLEKAARVVEPWLKDPTMGHSDWSNRLEATILYREAKTLIDGK